MSWKDKVVALYKRFGTPVKFAVKLVLGAVVPGGSAVVDLIGQALDCCHETAKDNLEFDESRLPSATAEDLKRLEDMLDVLGGDLAGLTEQVAALEGLPEAATKILDAALKTDDRCRAAVAKLDSLAQGFDVLRKQNEELLRGQGYAAGILEEMLPLMRRMTGVADFVDDLCREGLTAAEFRAAFAEFREGIRALARGRVAEAGARLEEVARSRPTSAAAAVAVAAAQTAKQDLSGAQKTLARAVRLRPQDAALAELQQRVTRASQATPAERPAPSPSSPQPKVGDVLDGWRLEQLLGHGGWGQVFKARRGEEIRALKVMHPELARDPAFVQRFRGEILTLARLGGHKHLVEIHDFNYASDASCWYLLMAFIDGVSLEQYLLKKGPLTVGQARGLFLAAADGLAAAHARGVVHRDVKPDNLLLAEPHGQPVWVDFGLAALAGGAGQTRAGQSAGYTPMFAAPEQLRGKTADARSDVYSLAATLYYSVNYDKPDLREPDRFEPEHAPEAFRELLTRSLDRWPEKRPANAAEFRALLEGGTSAVIVPAQSQRKAGDLYTNALGMKFAWIPPGTFLMGSPDVEEGRFDDEGPQHEVILTQPFYMGVYPVTQGEYEKVIGKNPSWYSKDGGGIVMVQGLDTSRFPVERVTWDDAVAFCEALNEQDKSKPAGWSYGLPTEAEREYACRAGKQTAYSFGDDPKQLGDYAWFDGNAGGRPHEVGTKKPNPWGLHDMHGDVWQWCADGKREYEKRLFKDPKSTDNGDRRVLRGGSWDHVPRYCRSAHRVDFGPRNRSYSIGFRVVLRPAARTP